MLQTAIFENLLIWYPKPFKQLKIRYKWHKNKTNRLHFTYHNDKSYPNTIHLLLVKDHVLSTKPA